MGEALKGKHSLGVPLALAAIVLAAGGCSSHEVDQKAWTRELADIGQPSPDFAKLEKITRDLCGRDPQALQLFVAAQRDAGGSMEAVRIGFRNVCPDQLEKLTQAENALDDATTSVKKACDTPLEERSQDQKDLAEAMGCG